MCKIEMYNINAHPTDWTALYAIKYAVAMLLGAMMINYHSIQITHSQQNHLPQQTQFNRCASEPVSRWRVAICCGVYVASSNAWALATMGNAIAVEPSGSGPKLHDASRGCTEGGAKVPRSLTLPLRHTCAHQTLSRDMWLEFVWRRVAFVSTSPPHTYPLAKELHQHARHGTASKRATDDHICHGGHR